MKIYLNGRNVENSSFEFGILFLKILFIMNYLDYTIFQLSHLFYINVDHIYNKRQHDIYIESWALVFRHIERLEMPKMLKSKFQKCFKRVSSS